MWFVVRGRPAAPESVGMIVAIVAGGTFVAALWLTGWVRRQALAHLMLDVPNSRSSHTVATPRGGGVAIVLASLGAMVALGFAGQVEWSSVQTIGLGGTIAALIGFADDRRHLAPRWRLLGHFTAATLSLASLGGVPPITIVGITVGSGPAWPVIMTFYLVWMLNLTNFMDGIDGLAGVETITVCVSAAILISVAAPGSGGWIGPVVLASATLGFLVWNWPPARIFMGDAGSGFLGLTLGILALQSAWLNGRLFWSWMILLGVFIVDATLTLLRRMLRSERIFEAHRQHAYQHAAASLGAHLPATITVGTINLCWLLPLALLVATGRLSGIVGVLLGYAPLVLAAARLNAGGPSAT